MDPNLIYTAIEQLLSLAIRLSEGREEDLEEYIETRRQVRKALVAEAGQRASEPVEMDTGPMYTPEAVPVEDEQEDNDETDSSA